MPVGSVIRKGFIDNYGRNTDMVEWVVNFLMLLFIMLIATGVIMIIIHELGHLIFGWFSGFKFLLFRIWNLTIVKSGNRYRFCIIKRPDSLGQCIMYSEKMDRNPKKMMYGGIIFNLMFGILMMMAGFYVNDYMLCYILNIIGIVNILSALINYMSSNMTDDGQGIRDMKNLNDIICYNCQLVIARYLVEGRSYKEMDSRLFVVNRLLPDSSSYEKELYFYGYYRLLEMGCLQEAEERLQELISSGITSWLATEVRRERIFFYNLRSCKNRIKGNGICKDPSDVRIYGLNLEVLNKFKKYIYQGEVKSIEIILKKCISDVTAVPADAR